MNFHRIKKFIGGLFIAFFSLQVSAELLVENAYVRASIPGADNTAAYMTLVNKSETALTLVKVTSTISKNIEIHEHTMNNGRMSMAKVERLTIPANDEVIFQPHGYHLMVFNVIKPLNNGETVALTLHFKGQPPLTVNYSVQGLNQAQHKHHH